MYRLNRTALIIVILLSCVGCDQTTKSLARAHLQGHAVVSYMGDMVRLQYAENPGAFLSLGATLPHSWASFVFIVGGAALLTAVISYAILASRLGLLPFVGLALICGGGVSNLIDRVIYEGHVTDFLNMGVGPVRTGIFNVADVALTLGVALFVLGRASMRQKGTGT